MTEILDKQGSAENGENTSSTKEQMKREKTDNCTFVKIENFYLSKGIMKN